MHGPKFFSPQAHQEPYLKCQENAASFLSTSTLRNAQLPILRLPHRPDVVHEMSFLTVLIDHRPCQTIGRGSRRSASGCR